MDLNNASAKEFAAHPYLSWNQANAIVKYREQHGVFENVDQLTSVKSLNVSDLRKAKLYLKID